MPEDHVFNITPYWLLGFAEGDGSFLLNHGTGFVFVLTQKGNLGLFNAIKDYLENLARNDYSIGSDVNVVHINTTGGNISRLYVRQTDFLELVLIPLFGTLSWHSKKYLDYC